MSANKEHGSTLETFVILAQKQDRDLNPVWVTRQEPVSNAKITRGPLFLLIGLDLSTKVARKAACFILLF